MACKRGRELVENEEQGKNKKMKSIVFVVEEQEQEQEQEEGSETRFVDLDEDTLLNVLKLVDVFTLGRAACVNKLWRRVAHDERLWEPILIRFFADIVKPPPDFYSIDFSKKIRPWR